MTYSTFRMHSPTTVNCNINYLAWLLHKLFIIVNIVNNILPADSANKPLKDSYDLVVIGGGSAGLACAKETAKFNKSVLVIDYVTPTPRGTTWGIGGTCINVGCIPKKLMHRAATIRKEVQDAKEYGWDLPGVKDKIHNNWEKLMENIHSYIKSLRWKIKRDLKLANIQLVQGMGSFIDNKTINVMIPNGPNDKEHVQVTADNILIAVGSRPIYPPKPEELTRFAITSDDLFYMKKPPGRTLVIGGGYIALECAGFIHGLGFPVTIAVRTTLQKMFDREMIGLVKDYMIEDGIEFFFQCEITSVTITDTSAEDGRRGYFVEWFNHEKNVSQGDTFNTILVATGRSPNTKYLQLDNAGVVTQEETGKIYTNDFDSTSTEYIYAAGDCIFNSPELAPVAVEAGRRLAWRLYGRRRLTIPYENIPTVLFTPLEYASMGFSERAALFRFGGTAGVEVLHSYYYPLEWEIPRSAQGGENSKCYVKAISLVKNDKIIGIHITGPNAGEVIQGFAVAMQYGLTIEQLTRAVGIHPTIAEEFTRLTITKRSGKDPKQMSCCNK